MIAMNLGRRMLAAIAAMGLASWVAVAQERPAAERRYAEPEREYVPQDDNRPDNRRAQYEQGRPAQVRPVAGEDAPYPGDTRRAVQPAVGQDNRAQDNRAYDNRVQDNRSQDNRVQGNQVQENVGQDNRGQAGNGAGNGQLQPAAPFQLNSQQQRFVDELLAAWEKHSSGIKTFECEFTRWEYTPNFGPLNANGQLAATAISSGQMKYIKPDKGLFRVTETRTYNKTTGKYEKTGADVGEHWVCDGKVVWEVDHRAKQVKEHVIPAEMQGEQIANGPLPFMLFGGEAAKLKARYFMREQTDPQFAKEEIWLESFPRWAGDAANYRSAHLIMKRADFLPYALRMFSNNGADYTVFEFRKIKLNNVFTPKIKVDVPADYQLVRPQEQTAAQNPAAGAQR
jgi:TIGR03009 family protein